MTGQDHSSGIIPLRKVGSCFELLFIKHVNSGHWSFPKGHLEAGEDIWACAQRELFEETGLKVVEQLKNEPFSEEYTFLKRGHKVGKRVDYFVCICDGELLLQKTEIAEAMWVPLKEAWVWPTFSEGKALVTAVQEFLDKKSHGAA